MEPVHDGGAGSKEPAISPVNIPPTQPPTGESQESLMERRRSNLSASSFLSSSTSSFNSLLDINEYDLQLTPKTPQTPTIKNQAADPNESPAPPAQAPVSQIANKSFVGYDPNRIPSSVFSRKPTGQMDWSVASNESLFSIHMGNNSFSLGNELMFPFDQHFNNLPARQPIPPPPVSETGKSPSLTTFEGKEETITKPPQIITVKDEPDLTNNRVGSLNCHETSDPRVSDSTSTTNFSDASGNSSNSFVFPLLTSDVSTSGPPPSSGKPTEGAAPTPLEKVVSSKEELEETEKSKSGQHSPSGDHNKEEGPGSKTWLSYFSCFSFCPINLGCLGGRANCTSNPNGVEPETKNPELKKSESKD